MKEIIQSCIKKGCLVDSQLLNTIRDINPIISEDLIDVLLTVQNKKILTKNLFFDNLKKIVNIFEEIKQTSNEQKKKAIDDFINNFSVFSSKKSDKIDSNLNFEDLKIIKLYNIPGRKIVVNDFVKHFKSRLIELKSTLQERPELTNLTSINKISNQRQNVSIIGLVYNIRYTKNKNIIIEIEDLTGKTIALVHNSKEDLIKKAKELVLDEVIGLRCNGNSEILFVNDILFPDSILYEKKKSHVEEYAAFTSDTHIGSTRFLEENFLKFVRWLNGDVGSEEQRNISKKVKYLFLVGDCVDGVGVYPNQEALLAIPDIKDQYKKLAELLTLIRGDIKIIMCPGQHDSVRVAEPQPPFDKNFAAPLHEIKNLFLVSNPALVTIGSTKNFPGFKVLMYHGASFHNLINEIEELRAINAHHTPSKVVKYVLRKRHLAPEHSSVVYIPAEGEDPLAITITPDIITTGEIHKTDVSFYNNILSICCSCWQSITPYEEKVGNEPDPCKVPLLNLQNGKVNILDFS
jgi:DNA polymerase II small subunit